MLIEKVRQRTFLYDTKSPDYRDQHEGQRMGRDREGVENKTFYVSSRDVRIVCPRLKLGHPVVYSVYHVEVSSLLRLLF